MEHKPYLAMTPAERIAFRIEQNRIAESKAAAVKVANAPAVQAKFERKVARVVNELYKSVAEFDTVAAETIKALAGKYNRRQL